MKLAAPSPAKLNSNEPAFDHEFFFQESYGSIFSHYIIEGLQGYADENMDGVCSAEEAFYYAKPLVLKHGVQHPTIVDNYIGELPLSKYASKR